ncbi:TIGR03013 family PEP-CTERM/XrtA system glycosyltransferase [bacterium]|nr:TIGR03013 family PEP-CTERM/XrtA system glycosyltransferase [bacterium]
MRAFFFGLFQDLLIIAAILLAGLARYHLEPYEFYSTQRGIVAVGVVYLIYKACFHYFNLYQVKLHLSLREFVNRLLTVNIVALVVLTILYYAYPPLVIGRGILALSVIFVMFFTTLYRFLWGWLSRDVAFSNNLLVLGAQEAARVVLEEVEKYRHSGYDVIGVLAKDPQRVGERFFRNHRIIGTFDDLAAIAERRRVDMIVMALDRAAGAVPLDTLMMLKLSGVRILESTQFHEQFTGKIVLEGLRSSWFLFSDGFTMSRFSQVVKRVFDLLMSAMLFLTTLPLTAAVVLLIKLTSRGPIFYKQERMGLNGKSFMLYKFRSMREDSETAGPVWASENDPRVTRIGRFIRRFRVDEIPQVLNVIRGEMSFVGPRPERPFFVEKLSRVIPYYHQRHLVKPGITGWAQVRYPYGSSIEDAREKLQLDLYYIKNVNLWFDIKIMMETVGVVLGKMKVH